MTPDPPASTTERGAGRRPLWQVIAGTAGGAAVILWGAFLVRAQPVEWTPVADRSSSTSLEDRQTVTALVDQWVTANPTLEPASHLGTLVVSECDDLPSQGGGAACELDAYQVDAWSGDFDEVAKPAKAALAAQCGKPAAPAVRKTPDQYRETEMESYGCPGGLQVDLTFYVSTDSTGYIMNKNCRDFSTWECISGPTPDEILTRLRGYDWVAIRVVHKGYWHSG